MKLLYTFVTIALAVAVSGKQLHAHHKHGAKYVLKPGESADTKSAAVEIIDDPDNKEDIQDEINLTPYLRLTKENQWLAGVPNYEDPKEGYTIKTFLKEHVARKWIYDHTGAHQSINYPMPEGLDPVNGGVGFIEEGSGSGSEGGSSDIAAALLEQAEGGSDGSADEGSEEGSDDAGSEAAPATAFCQECQDKLDAINARIGEVEGKIAARKDGGAITGITATKGEIVDVTIHREGDTAFLEEEGSGSDSGSDAGSAGSAQATSFLEEFSQLRGSGSADEDSGSDAAGSAAALLELFSQTGSAGSGDESGSGSDDAAGSAAPAAAFIEKMKSLRNRKH